MTTNRTTKMMPDQSGRSPIEQQIIDGLVYWDRIGNEWFRLILRATNHVIGHVKPAMYPYQGNPLHTVATFNHGKHGRIEQTYPDQASARREVELFALENFLK